MEHQGEFLDFTDLNILTLSVFSLDGDAVNSKRLLSSWTLHFAAKKTSESI
jgi:dolichyl-phosphate-mannose-protein mannosyltransferase